MKTSKITLPILALCLIFFMSATSIANPYTGTTGDIVKSDIKKQLEGVKNTTADITGSSQNEFSHLRFNVNNFNNESEINELPLNPDDYLRFDVNQFTNGTISDITELPMMTEFDYLRFDVTNFNNLDDIFEMPLK